MSLPDSFFDELRTRLSLHQVAGRKVMWDPKKSNAAKGDYWAPCPFHQEKTASFHVDDRKGFYYCFGCHAKGDAIKFVRETENVGFMEAVEILAREAGMQMPARDPRQQERMDHNKVLADVMDQAVRFYRMQLSSNTGADARAYLEKRGLPQDIQDRFEIGFAPPGWDGLMNALTAKGIKTEHLVETGMAIESDKGKAPYDRFRNRIMFPIRDARGRCIAFGGRAMAADERAKYLNSPETPLFDKSRTLYNLAPAREAAGKTGQLIVAEGYMDVIALAQYGFAQAVAPLGTAITEHQLAMLWRIYPEPIIALDGDKAGIRAAERLIDLAMPLLEAGKSLRFVILPEGQDPDDLLKSSGAKAMQKLLEQAEPMVNLLWRRETEGQSFDSPERRAALDARLRQVILKIQDKSLRSHYGAAIADLRRGLFAPSRPQNQRQNVWTPRHAPKTPKSDTKTSYLAAATAPERMVRESVILCAAILRPKTALELEAELDRCPIASENLRPIHDSLLSHLHHALSDDDTRNPLRDAMSHSLGEDPVTFLKSLRAVAIHPHLSDSAAPDKTERTLREELRKHEAVIGSEMELQEAEQDIDGLADERLTRRLAQAAEARVAAIAAAEDEGEKTEENEEKLSQHLQSLLDAEIWVKKKR